MNRNDHDGALDPEGPGQAGVSSQHKDSLPAIREEEIQGSESAVIAAEAAALSRDELLGAREAALHLRENSADLREAEIRAAETIHASSDDLIALLQQANARLVIAAIDAQIWAEQLQAAKIEMESAKFAAEKANLAKSEFLSSMSHELRTPLNAILGFAQLLEAELPPPTDRQAASLRQITKAGWYLLELINEILDLAVIESGKLSLLRESVSLSDVMSECQAMSESQAQKHGVRMVFPRLDNPFHVHADRTRVKQVIANLLSNAIKYNRAGGTVVVECAMKGEQRVRVSVTDTGAGLAPEKVAQLFQPFSRLGQETGREEGTGIGLVVTKQLVELMGGRIGVESSVGVGSVFWFELPVSSAPDLLLDSSSEIGADEPDQVATPELSSQRTLLYVEDNPANLALVEQLITRHSDLQLLSAADGPQGIQLARARQPDVILMDIKLPGISGLGALKLLQADPATAHIPVIALSANAIPRDIDKGIEAGFFRYLTKPIKIDELMAALDAALLHTAENHHTNSS